MTEPKPVTEEMIENVRKAVRRLRASAKHVRQRSVAPNYSIVREVDELNTLADAIEAVLEDRKQLKGLLNAREVVCDTLLDKNAKLKANVERLRGTLIDVSHEGWPRGNANPDRCLWCGRMSSNASTPHQFWTTNQGHTASCLAVRIIDALAATSPEKETKREADPAG